MIPIPSDPLGEPLRAAVATEIEAFLDTQTALVSEVGATPLQELARAFTAGGKRVRPAFAYWGWVAAAGPMVEPGLVQAAASLDLLHVSALVHDDLIDASDTRRGQPAAHHQLAHLAPAPGAASSAFGEAAAILLGDLLVMWSVEMFERAALPAAAIARAQPHLWAMRSEVTCGQYLDVAAAYSATGARSSAEAREVSRRILEYKSARYSVRRPAQIGAALAGADEHLMTALATFGSGIGRAFQLRDDVLGIYGDPARDRQAGGDDIREGKQTLLVLTALTEGTPAQRTALSALLGSPDLTPSDVARARDIIAETGSLAVVEQRIEDETSAALTALDASRATPEGRAALTRLAELSTRRDS